MANGESEALPIGKVVNQRFQILRIVGQGGLGTVYQVRDTIYGKNNVYALKELIDRSEGARKQFIQEATWLQALDHRHIPKVRDHFEWDDRLYLVMDFVDGENLDQMLRRRAGRGLPEAQVIQWILPICDALQYLHSRTPPILHRDVKPSNIIVTASGHPVLVDLGIAKEHGPGARATATFVRKAGTEGYAPPEQYTSAGQTGPWSDVYSLGATLYELLTGCIPPTAVERVALDVRLVDPREINPTISPSVAATIVKALAIRPADRFQYVSDLAASLGALSGLQPSEPQPSGLPFAPTPSGPLRGSSMGQMPSSPPASRISEQSVPLRGSPSPPFASPFGPAPSPLAPPMAPARPATSGPGRVAPPSPARQYPSGIQLGGMGAAGAAPPVAPAPRGASETLPRSSAPLAHDEQEDARSGRRWYALPVVWFAALAGVLVLVAVLGITLLGLFTPLDRSTPQATVTGYFKALQAQDNGRAWQYTALSRNDPNQQSAFMSQLQADDARYGRVLSYQVGQISAEAPGQVQATVTVTRADQPSAPITDTLSLSEYDGTTWLIDSISGP